MTKRKNKSSQSVLWRWDDGSNLDQALKRGIGAYNPELDGPDTSRLAGPSLNLQMLMVEAPHYDCYMPLPYEILLKIFVYVVESSDNPIHDLFNIARVCEDWRQTVLNTPILWRRVDITQIPATKSNISILAKIFSNDLFIKAVREFAFTSALAKVSSNSILEILIKSPNLEVLSFREAQVRGPSDKLPMNLARLIRDRQKLKSLSLSGARRLFSSQKWFFDFLNSQGTHLEVLDLSMSLNVISFHLCQAICHYCPNLRVLDLTTYHSISEKGFDAVHLAQSLTQLEVFRAGNVSFKRVLEAPARYGLDRLRELYIPAPSRDNDRDDCLIATLAFGSLELTVLDIRGCLISVNALIDMPSSLMKEFHMDDICPGMRKQYWRIMFKWRETLEILSLVKISCAATIKSCLKALKTGEGCYNIKQLDLSASDIDVDDLKDFLISAKSLKSIDLTSCRSLPRGCKGIYTEDRHEERGLVISDLRKRLNLTA